MYAPPPSPQQENPAMSDDDLVSTKDTTQGAVNIERFVRAICREEIRDHMQRRPTETSPDYPSQPDWDDAARPLDLDADLAGYKAAAGLETTAEDILFHYKRLLAAAQACVGALQEARTQMTGPGETFDAINEAVATMAELGIRPKAKP